MFEALGKGMAGTPYRLLLCSTSIVLQVIGRKQNTIAKKGGV